MKCCTVKRLLPTVSAGSDGDLGALDINASPPREFDGSDVGLSLNSELALANSAPKMQDTCGNSFVGFSSTSPNTHTNTASVANGFPSTSSSYSTMQIARMNLDIATQNANLVFLQALKVYVAERRGVLEEGWRVRFEYSENMCKNSPIYCAPNGRRFDSMQEVARYLGLLSDSNSVENSSAIPLLQNCKNTLHSRVSNGGPAVEVEVEALERCNNASESFLDGFPIQFQDFFVTSIGKIDPRISFHNTSQIWPIGYKSMWHDKLTGSIFVCNVLNNGDYGPIFRVNRYPCTKHSLPNASTVIYKKKSEPLDEMPSCSNTISTLPLQETQIFPFDNFINRDLIGEFSMEGRSTSSVWQMALETLLCAIRQSFRDLNVVSFCCNHSVNEEQFNVSHGIDSLDKFGYLNGPINSIPRLILNEEQLEVCCVILRKWLQVDRFGLDTEFVQEVIEKLPGVAECLEYKSLDSRCGNLTSRTVGSGFFTILRKCNSQMMVSDSLVENRMRISPPGNIIASNLPSGLIGDVLQIHEFCLRFHNVLGQDAPLPIQNLENELLNPWVANDKTEDFTSSSTIIPYTKPHDRYSVDATKESIKSTGAILSNYQMAMLKNLVGDLVSKIVIRDPSDTMESKPRKRRRRNMDLVFSSNKRIKLGIFPVNEITWPELARRYISVLLSTDDNLESLDITSSEFGEMFRCLNGDGGPLCGFLTGLAAIEADAAILTEAKKKIFSSVKSKVSDFVIDTKDLDFSKCATEAKKNNNKCPEWIKVLEPIRQLPTNVGAKIRDRVRISLQKNPPQWAKNDLLTSISKEVYKGNAAGPTKRIVVEVLNKARNENPLVKKKSKESRVVKTLSDVIIKRCRMVLRSVAAEDVNRAFFSFIAESFMKPNEYLAMVSRPLDFRTIDIRLDAGFYCDSLESFIEDVREVWQNLRITYQNKPKLLDSIEEMSKKIEELFAQEVLPLVNKSITDVNELNVILADTIASTLFVAPWENGICKVCGKDENDHVLLLCDRCDAEYHTYCLNPPLQRVPKGCWYCPPCISFIANQANSRQEHSGITMLSHHVTEKKKIRREFSQSGLVESLADLVDSMESMEYWELGVKERVLLLQFLCDESLTSTLIRDQISSNDYIIPRNLLGQDSSGRLYWILGHPERLFGSGPHSIGEVCVASECSSSAWICYESDADVEALLEWLEDDDPKEKQLKESIIHWKRYKSNHHNHQVNIQVDRSRSSVHDTYARAELEKKFGLFLEASRCDCSELVGFTRHHCFSCHSTFFDNELHQCKENDVSLERVEAESNAAFLANQGVDLNRRSTSLEKQLTKESLEIFRCLKIILLDIEAALPCEASRSSRGNSERLRAWRTFIKSAQSIYEMVQATIILEDMVKSEHLKKEWWYWSSPSAAAKVSTISSLALRIYALDAAIYYEKPPPPPVDLTVPIAPEEAHEKSNLKMVEELNNPEELTETSTCKSKPKKKKLEVPNE